MDAICNIVGLKDLTSMNDSTKLSDLGLDSLMSVEVKNLVERETQISISIREVANITIKQLKNGFEGLTN